MLPVKLQKNLKQKTTNLQEQFKHKFEMDFVLKFILTKITSKAEKPIVETFPKFCRQINFHTLLTICFIQYYFFKEF